MRKDIVGVVKKIHLRNILADDSRFASSRKGVRIASAALFVGFLLCILAGLNLHRLRTQYSVMQFLPSHHPALEMDQSVRRDFHLTDLPTFIGIVTLNDNEAGTWLESERIEKLAKLTEAVGAMPQVGFSLSLANVDGASDVEGVLNVGTLVDVIPPQQWKSRILKDRLLTPGLITKDARSVVIYTQLTAADVDLLVRFEQNFRKLLSETFPTSSAHVGGVPAVQTDLGLLLTKEIRNFILLTLGACALTLFLIFSTLSTLLIPLILTAFANLMVFGFMAVTGLTFTVLSSTVPVLVFITVVSISAHILLRINEDAQHTPEGFTKWQLIVRANRAIWLPNLLGAMTTCVGFLTLFFSDVPLIRDYGIGVAEAVTLSWVLTSLGILPLLYVFPLPRPRSWVRQPAHWARWAIQKRKPIVISVALGCVLLLVAGHKLDWTGKLFDDLPEGQEARQSTEKIDRSMGGVIPVEIVIQGETGDWNDPKHLQKLDQLMDQLRHVEGVGSVHGIPDFLRAVKSRGTPNLPQTRAAIAELYFLYSLSGNNPLESYLANNGKSARIEIKVHDIPSDQMRRLIDNLSARVQAEFPDNKVEIGGMGAIVHLIHDELSNSLIFGFWHALVFIVILLAFIFRSVRWALVACVPNLIPPLALLAFLAITHTPIKPGVAIIFSIALGLAFNNTVYLLSRIRTLAKGLRPLPISRSFYMEGNPCLISTMIILMGFSVFLFSYFSMNKTFGACMLVSLLAGILGDLIFLPGLLRMFPKLL